MDAHDPTCTYTTAVNMYAVMYAEPKIELVAYMKRAELAKKHHPLKDTTIERDQQLPSQRHCRPKPAPLRAARWPQVVGAALQGSLRLLVVLRYWPVWQAGWQLVRS